MRIFCAVTTLIEVWCNSQRLRLYKNKGRTARTKARFDSSISKLEEINSNVSLRAALEGIVLLENNGALPLKKMKVALYGAGASTTIKGGTGSGEVNERHVISILEGGLNE